jgi:hypothetical protein
MKPENTFLQNYWTGKHPAAARPQADELEH